METESESFAYLTSNTMATISSTLALASIVMSIDCTELWTLDSNGKYYCPYVYASSQLQARCPNLLTGHHPRDKIDHVLSPKLCEYAKKSSKRFHWRVFPTSDRPSTAYQGVTFPVLTEMAYYVENTQGVDIFIVGLAPEALQVRPSAFKFLQSLGYAIYVSAYIMDNEELGSGNDEENKTSELELDHKEFVPKSTIITPYISAINLAVMGGTGVDPTTIRKNISDANLRARARSIESNNGAHRSRGSSFCHIDIDEQIGMVLSDSSPPHATMRKAVSISNHSSPVVAPTSRRASREAHELEDHVPDEEGDAFDEEFLRNRHDHFMIQTRNRAPTWDPTYPFSYPVGEIPSDDTLPDDLTMKEFSKVVHLTDGSNANIFTATYKGDKVVIKMIKEGMATDPIALHEFDLEYGMLSRMNHKHIVKILGAGYEPRRFMVLEYLSAGTLHDLLVENESKKGFANMIFRKPTFTYIQLLQHARDMASALDYLHFRFHPGATIIHRDLKPDNVGFSRDGTLKLFDFGLVTCVRTRESPSEAYNMTGYTGSLRYMAPEVALREPYTEKVDVYSFGIMLWQMARDSLPFAGLGKTAFMQEVVRGNIRPKLDRSWPEGFRNLLTSCWARNPFKRPCFAQVIAELGGLIDTAARPTNSPLMMKGGNINRWF